MAALAQADRTFLGAVYDAGLVELDGVDLDHVHNHGRSAARHVAHDAGPG